VRYLFRTAYFLTASSGEFTSQDRDEHRSLIVRLQRLQLHLDIDEKALAIPNTSSPGRENRRMEREREPLSDDDMLFDMEGEPPNATDVIGDYHPYREPDELVAPANDVEISSTISSSLESEEDDEAPSNQRRTPPRRRNTFSLGRDAEVWRRQVMALRSQSLASLSDDYDDEVDVQIQNEIRSQEARNVNHDDVRDQFGGLNIADNDAEHSSAEDEGNEPRRVRGDSAGGGFRPCRVLKSTLAARPNFLPWNDPEVEGLLSSSDLEDLRTEDSAMSTYGG
jgi:hypothetical protein